MLSGLIYPTSGTARVAGFDPTKRENAYRRLFALVLGQKNQLWWDLPAIESFNLIRAIYGLPQDQFKATLDELVDLLDVAKKLNVMVRELSLGERMKMELIAALLHRPRVLFLDEPTIGLDVVSQRESPRVPARLQPPHRVTILLTSHYMADITSLCERVIVIDQGKKIYDGALDRLETTASSPCPRKS
jgi:ABC-2 type transport system ATP-binding protein